MIARTIVFTHRKSLYDGMISPNVTNQSHTDFKTDIKFSTSLDQSLYIIQKMLSTTTSDLRLAYDNYNSSMIQSRRHIRRVCQFYQIHPHIQMLLEY